MLYCLLVFPPLAFSAADAILEQVRQHLTQKGLEHARATARGFGIRLREQGGTTRVPIVMKRQAFRGKGFAQKLSNTGAQVDAQSRDYLRLLVPLSRLSDFIGQFPDEPLLRPVPVPAWGAGNQVSESVELTAAHGYQLAGYRGRGPGFYRSDQRYQSG